MSTRCSEFQNFTLSIRNRSYKASGPPKLDQVLAPQIADTAHDLLNLISNLKTRLYLAQKLPAQTAEHLSALEHLVTHLDELVNELIVSQLNGGTPTRAMRRCDLNRVTERIVEIYRPMAQIKGLTLSFDAARDLPTMLVDEMEIRRVVFNLLHNAVSYTPRGGSICVMTTHENDTVILTVRDTGIGISPEILPHIFRRFYRSEEAKDKASGSGLGLAITLGIVKKYGGKIDVESVPGKGTTFKVLIPAES